MHLRLPALISSLLFVTACAGLSAQPTPGGKPLIALLSPAEGARYAAGEAIDITVSAVSSAQLASIEIVVGGAAPQTRSIDPPETASTVSIHVTPNEQGRVTIAATAIDSTGVRGDPAIIHIVVGQEQPIEAAPGEATVPPGCSLAAQYVTDVSIPDGTQVQAGALFVKTWRMRNTSSCDWPAGYRLAFFENEPFGPVNLSDPLGPVAREAEFEVSVQLTAPAASGLYTSTWRLRDTTGKSFGNRVYVAIRVP
jgi:Ig-like domain from next to BRCA1 gene